jgi:uncharacterized protein
MEFKWHPAKAQSNLEKHGVSFEEAQTVFDDPNQMYLADEAHSIGEERFFCIGYSAQGRLLSVVCTEKPGDIYRLITAREATAHEREQYESQSYFA